MGDAYLALRLPVQLEDLPSEARAKIGELELELSEGDITSKGFEKKVRRLLAPYIHIASVTASQKQLTPTNGGPKNTSANQFANGQAKNVPLYDKPLPSIPIENRPSSVLNGSGDHLSLPRAVTPTAASTASAVDRTSTEPNSITVAHYVNVADVNALLHATQQLTPVHVKKSTHESIVITKQQQPSSVTASAPPQQRLRSRSRHARQAEEAAARNFGKQRAETYSKDENRYHSELRHEAVQQALAGISLHNGEKSSNNDMDVLRNTKRISMPAYFTNGDVSSDDDAENSSNTTSGTVSASSSLRTTDTRTASFIQPAVMTGSLNRAAAIEEEQVEQQSKTTPVALSNRSAEPPTSPPPPLPSSSSSSPNMPEKDDEHNQPPIAVLPDAGFYDAPPSAREIFAAILSAATPPVPALPADESDQKFNSLAAHAAHSSSALSSSTKSMQQPLLLQREKTPSLPTRTSSIRASAAEIITKRHAAAATVKVVKEEVSVVKQQNFARHDISGSGETTPVQSAAAAALPTQITVAQHSSPASNMPHSASATSAARPAAQSRLLSDVIMRQCRVTLPSTTSSSASADDYDNNDGNLMIINDNDYAENADAGAVRSSSSTFYANNDAAAVRNSVIMSSSSNSFLANRPVSTAGATARASSTVTPTPSPLMTTTTTTTTNADVAHARVSTKIQELLRTLKKPKRKPLEEYYEDDEDEDMETASTPVDPNAPKCEGPVMTPYLGADISSSPNLPESLEAALRRYGLSTPKAPAATVFDLHGKCAASITYGKLYTRALKVAYALLNRLTPTAASVSTLPGVGSSIESCVATSVKPGDRCAIVVPNNDPITFLTAFYGCVLAGVIPVPIEVPLTRRDAGVQAIGLLLSACGVGVALTSQKCFQSLPKCDSNSASTLVSSSVSSSNHTPSKAANHHQQQQQQQQQQHQHHHSGNNVLAFKSWPVPMVWCVVENCSKLPKDWQPPPQRNITTTQNSGDAVAAAAQSSSSSSKCAYIEYTYDRNGAVIGVMVSREACVAHCRALTSACGYVEGETLICVIDFKREVGLWHSVLCGVYNGIHSMFVPYSLMKVQPGSWLLQATKFKASVAIVKSRDLHWATLAQRDHRDVNLSSIRMVLVADGANPWSLTSCDQFITIFQSKGLRPDALCPCAASSEALTVALRRPCNRAPHSSGRGILSMSALTYGVVRVERENNLTSLTLQDCGQVLPSARLAVIRIAKNQPSSSSSLTKASRRIRQQTNPSSDSSISLSAVQHQAELCCSDEVGEICISSPTCGQSYWGLPGLSQQAFNLELVPTSSTSTSSSFDAESPNNMYENGDIVASRNCAAYVRTGLVGFLGPNGLVFCCGSRTGLMLVAGRRHNTDDIIATVLAVEPSRFIYRGRIAVFSVRVLRDERICVVAEQRPNCTEEESFAWMSRVLQAIDKIHQVGIYCLALVPPNQLPKTPLGGINLADTRKRFVDGCLNPSNLLLAPHNCITLGPPRQPPPDIGPAAVMVGSIVQGVRLAEARGRELGANEDETRYQFIAEILRWRAQATADNNIFTLMNARGVPISTLTCQQLHKRAERMAAHLLDKAQVRPGDHVALIYPPNLDLICAFYACLYAGVVAVPVRPFHPQSLESTLPTVRMTVEVARATCVMTTSAIARVMRSSKACALLAASNAVSAAATSATSSSSTETNHAAKTNSGSRFFSTTTSTTSSSSLWPFVLETDELAKRKFSTPHHVPSSVESACYYDFSVSTSGTLAGVGVSHAAVTALCRAVKLQCELYPSRYVAVALDPYSGLGFVLWCLSSVYAGHHSILIPAAEVELNSNVWLSLVSQYRVRDTFCSYGVMELTSRGLAAVVPSLKDRGVNLSCVRTCVVVAEERPRVAMVTTFCKLFSVLGLSPRAVSTSFGCRVNVAIAVQGASGPDPATVFVDLRALRNGRITLVERGAPHSLCLMESGKLLPGVKIVIADPDTRGQLSDSHLGEVWVASPFNVNGYYAVLGCHSQRQNLLDNNGQFQAHLITGDTRTTFARTGYLGFVRRTDAIGSNGEQHDALFIVGALEETFMLRGMRYHPIDIEASVMRADKRICECAVFTWTNLLVVVCELDGPENEALNLVVSATNAIIEEHHLIAGIVAVVDPGVVPINSKGEKQRMHLRDSFLADKLDPIYVAYNM